MEEHLSPLPEIDYANSVDIGMQQYGITTRNSDKPILLTNGAITCAAAAGLAREQGIGFLGHYSSETDPLQTIRVLHYDLVRFTNGEPIIFDVELTSGWIRSVSEAKRLGLEIGDTTIPQLRDVLTAMLNHYSGQDNIRYVVKRSASEQNAGVDTRMGKFIGDEYKAANNPFRLKHQSHKAISAKIPSLVYSPTIRK